MLDDDDRVSLIDQRVQNFQQAVDVFKMQAGRRLVENIQRLAGCAPGQFLGQLDSLGFAAGKGCCLLTEVNISETDFAQQLQTVFN